MFQAIFPSRNSNCSSFCRRLERGLKLIDVAQTLVCGWSFYILVESDVGQAIGFLSPVV